MPTTTFTISTALFDRIKAAMTGLYPIPQIIDPTCPTKDTQPELCSQIPEFTENQWAKEAVRRFIKHSVKRWETKIAKDSIQSIDVDDSEIT